MRVKPTAEQIAELQESISKFETMTKFSNALRLNKGIISMAVNGDYLSPTLARKMGWCMPVEVMPCNNPDCPDFGEPHIYDCREQVVKPKPRKRQPRPSVPYFKCRQDDIEQVRRQVEKYLPGYELKRKE